MKKSRIFLWLLMLAVSLTGIALYWMAPATEDDFPHPLNGLFRELHGASMALCLIIFGYMLAEHVQKKLAKRGHYWDGYLHLGVWIGLIVTGLLLYYPQTLFDDWGINMPQWHWYLGLALIAIMPLHTARKYLKRYYYRWRFKRSQRQAA
jgi:MFS family permease